MKTIFIPAKSRKKLNKSSFLKDLNILPENIAILYSIQYEDIAKEIRLLLKKEHTITQFSQILGCSRVIPSKETKAILLIGSGRFHALAVASSSNLPIYMYEGERIEKISEKEIVSFNQRKKTAQIKFLSSEKIGVLVSTKPGQQNLIKALKLKEKIKQKQLYFFLGDYLFVQELENFELNSWINTACPRLDMDSTSIINVEDLNLRNRKNSL
jgi:diphthamide biosynthesis enzyme Dph1/Dph2-like protein